MECSMRNGTAYETTQQTSVVIPSQASHVENLSEKLTATQSRPLEDINVDGDSSKKSSGNDVSLASMLASLSQLSITNQELNLSANPMLTVPGFCWPNVQPDDQLTSFNQSAYQNFSLLGNSGITSSLGLEQLQQPASQWSTSAALGYTLPPGGNSRAYPGWGSTSQLTLSMLARNGLGTRGSINHSRSMSVQNVNLSTEPQSGRAAGFTSGINLAPHMTKQCSDRLIPEGNRMAEAARIPLGVGLNQDPSATLDSQWLDLIRVAASKDNPKGLRQQDPQNTGKVLDPSSWMLAQSDGRYSGKVGLFDNSLVRGETYLLDHFTARKLCFPGKAGLGSQPALNRVENFSRKVFVGGLPPDIDEDEIMAAFRHLGPLVVDWPHKSESKSYFPPKGYCFLLFQDELSVQALVDACIMEDTKLYWRVSSPTMKDKPVQIRPWNLADADYVMDSTQPLDPRKTVFVGGVPRPLRAVELAIIMARLYGGVCYAGIDTDPELKYPKGAGRVSFSSQQSYIAAISARFVQLQLGDIDKRVEVKPYVLDDQICDECQGLHSAGKFAPFFCANVMCLQYYCEHCWSLIHSSPNREFHKPLVKEGADRPRALPFRWC